MKRTVSSATKKNPQPAASQQKPTKPKNSVPLVPKPPKILETTEKQPINTKKPNKNRLLVPNKLQLLEKQIDIDSKCRPPSSKQGRLHVPIIPSKSGITFISRYSDLSNKNVKLHSQDYYQTAMSTLSRDQANKSKDNDDKIIKKKKKSVKSVKSKKEARGPKGLKGVDVKVVGHKRSEGSLGEASQTVMEVDLKKRSSAAVIREMEDFFNEKKVKL